jgi:hypothetical protein
MFGDIGPKIKSFFCGPYQLLGNNNGVSAVATPQFGRLGSQAISSSIVLTASSPTFNYVTNSGVTVTLPPAISCLGKEIIILNATLTSTIVLSVASGDEIYYNSVGSTSYTVSSSCSIGLVALASGKWQIYQQPSPWSGSASGFIGSAAGGLVYNTYFDNSPSYASSAAGTAGQIWLSGGSGAPTVTSSPTITHQIAGGTAPTVAANAGAGSSPTISIAGHDTDCAVTLTTGSTPTGTNATIFTVTFGTAYASAPYVHITPANANAAAITGGATEVYVNSSTTTMTLISGTTALSAATQYIWNIHSGQ